MQFFGKKEIKIINMFEVHMKAVEGAVETLIEMIREYERDRSSVEEMADKLRKAESEADSKRREMETEMYLGAFLPNFRGDLLGIAESIDIVANKAESTGDLIELENIDIPKEFISDLVVLARKSLETYKAVAEAAKAMFDDLDIANEEIKKTERLENEGDTLEKDLVRKLFRNEKIELAHKLQLQKLVKKIADIADQAENVSDRIQIVLFKRRV